MKCTPHVPGGVLECTGNSCFQICAIGNDAVVLSDIKIIVSPGSRFTCRGANLKNVRIKIHNGAELYIYDSCMCDCRIQTDGTAVLRHVTLRRVYNYGMVTLQYCDYVT